MLITELPSCPLIEEPSRKSSTPVSNLLIFKGNKILIAQIQKNIPPIQETIPNHNRKALPENISKLVIIKPVVVNELTISSQASINPTSVTERTNGNAIKIGKKKYDNMKESNFSKLF